MRLHFLDAESGGDETVATAPCSPAREMEKSPKQRERDEHVDLNRDLTQGVHSLDAQDRKMTFMRS